MNSSIECQANWAPLIYHTFTGLVVNFGERGWLSCKLGFLIYFNLFFEMYNKKWKFFIIWLICFGQITDKDFQSPASNVGCKSPVHVPIPACWGPICHTKSGKLGRGQDNLFSGPRESVAQFAGSPIYLEPNWRATLLGLCDQAEEVVLTRIEF